MGILVVAVLALFIGFAIYSVVKKDDNSSDNNGGGGGGVSQGNGVYDQNGHPVTSGQYR